MPYTQVMGRKGLNIGAERFPEYFVRGREAYYVDKTLLVKELIDAHLLENSPQLILRPRRFGKTLTLSMLKTFFDQDEKENSWMFRDLAISRHAELCEEHQNKYPVISVSFKDTESNSYDELLENLNSKLKRETQRHKSAIISEAAFDGEPRQVEYDREDRDGLLRIAKGQGTERDLKNCFEALTHMLYGYYRVKPLVFIDEYDAPLNNAFSNEYFEEAASLVRAMLSSGFKTNDCLGGVVMTGILQVSKSNILSGLNNLVVNSVDDSRFFSEAFGFTQDEVDGMLEYYSLQDRREDLRSWYDGYSIGKCFVYNPFSLSNAVNAFCYDENAVCKNYWLDTGGTKLLKEMLASCKGDHGLKLLFDRLLEGESVAADYTTAVAYSEILDSSRTITGALLLSGYLTLDDAKLRIPNREVLAGFAALCEWYNKDTDEEMLPDLVRAYADGNPGAAKDILDEYFEETLRARDLNSSGNNYHYFICGAMAAVAKRLGDWSFESNEQKALGYADLVFTNRKAKRAVIIEEKALKDDAPRLSYEEEADWVESQVERLSGEAFSQIHNTRYDSKYRRQGYEVTCYANVYFRHEAFVVKEA